MTARLRELQGRFFALVTGRDDLTRARGLSEWLAFDGDDAARARLRVYETGYAYRLVDSLREDFPAVAAALGEAFDKVARDYVAAAPPRSPRLADFGHRFAPFVAEHPAAHGRPWLGELAALEHARVAVFHAPDAALLTMADLAAIPQGAWPAHVFTLAASARVFTFAHDVDAAWRAADGGLPFPTLAPAPTAIVVFRHPTELVSCHRVLDAREAAALLAVRARAPFADVCEAFSDVPDAPERALEALVGWVQAGLLAAP